MMDFRDRRRFVLCFGAQRGGTTWLSNQLRPHPECDFPYRKELRYLDALHYHDFDKVQARRLTEFRVKLDKLAPDGTQSLSKAASRELLWWSNYAFTDRDECDDNWYRGLFRHCDPDKLTGDFSPDYSLLGQPEIDHLKSLLPEQARLVFILRNPVERLWSGITYGMRHNKALTQEQQLKRALMRLEKQLPNDFSDYPGILGRFENSFGRENILYLFHEDLQNTPLDVLREVCGWLDISYDPEYFPKIGKSTNRSPSLKMPPEIRTRITRQYAGNLEWLQQRFGGHAETWLTQARELLAET